MSKKTHSQVLNYESCPWPKDIYRTYMNGRLKKIDMEARLLKLKEQIERREWYPHWDDRERWAAQQALNNALEVLNEFDY